MKIGILGTGSVGATIGTKLVALGHEVKLGSRAAGGEKAVAWARQAGAGASEGTFADAAMFGEIVFNCTHGVASLEALRAAGAANLRGKILVDVANPLDFAKGMPPRIVTGPDGESLAEQIQRAFPEARVVKALNTINANVMVDPARVAGGDHDLFLAGDDAQAKARVRDLLGACFGWKRFVDLGGLVAARGTEAYVLFWVQLWGAFGRADFSVKVVR